MSQDTEPSKKSGEEEEVPETRETEKEPEQEPIEEEEEYDGERVLTVSFFPEVLSAPKWNRASKTVKILKGDIKKRIKYVEDPLSGRETRIDQPIIKISPKLNDKLHNRGGKGVPRKVRVRVLYTIRDPEQGRVKLQIKPI